MWVTVRIPFIHEGRHRDLGEVFEVADRQARRLMQVNRVEEAWLGPCTAETRRCDQATSYVNSTPECCRAHRRRLIQMLATLFARHEVTWWADYGTLLGAVRHRGMIPHDKDEDLGILASDLEKLLAARHEFEAEGHCFRYRKAIGGKWAGGDRVKLCLSWKNRTNVDVFPWHEGGDGTFYRRAYIQVDRYKGREFTRDMLFPLSTVEWEGMTLPAPRDPEAWCEFRYGPGWRTPIARNHDGRPR